MKCTSHANISDREIQATVLLVELPLFGVISSLCVTLILFFLKLLYCIVMVHKVLHGLRRLKGGNYFGKV